MKIMKNPNQKDKNQQETIKGKVNKIKYKNKKKNN
jgi:hypothetical protein